MASRKEELILLALQGNECLYGREIIKAVQKSSKEANFDADLSANTLYPSLAKLAGEKKLIERCEQPANVERHAGAERTYYRITGKGSDYLRKVEAFRAALLGA